MSRSFAGSTTTDQAFLDDVLAGLSHDRKTLPSKYFYDATGSELFEQICELDEYYPTRTELSIMERHVAEISSSIGPHHLLLELGSGSSTKTELLLESLHDLAVYVPFDISQSALDDAVSKLARQFPELSVHSVCGDFMEQIELPQIDIHHQGTVTYFPGSTIGNLTDTGAIDLLRRIREVDRESELLIGIDLVKDRGVLLSAYNDAAGVTAQFNLNLLERINRELGSEFDLDQFRHRAIYNEPAHRIEMQLVSQRSQSVQIAGETLHFSEGESICTEYSHKYTIDRFSQLARAADFQISNLWTDEQNWFAVLLLAPLPHDRHEFVN